MFSQSAFPQQQCNNFKSSGVGARDIFVKVVVKSSIVAFARYKLFVSCESGVPGRDGSSNDGSVSGCCIV